MIPPQRAGTTWCVVLLQKALSGPQIARAVLRDYDFPRRSISDTVHARNLPMRRISPIRLPLIRIGLAR